MQPISFPYFLTTYYIFSKHCLVGICVMDTVLYLQTETYGLHRIHCQSVVIDLSRKNCDMLRNTRFQDQ